MGVIKKVFGASAVIILANGLNRVFAIFAAPVLTRVLGPAPYGIMALIGTVTSMASTLGLLGIDISYARFYFSKADTAGHAVEKFCWRYASLSSIVIGILTALFWHVLWGKSNHHPIVASIVGVTTLLFVINTMSQTRARLRDEYSRMGLAMIVSGISATSISVVLALVWRIDEWPLLIGFASGILINVILTGIPRSSLLLNKSGLTVKEKWPIIKLGLPGIVTVTMYWVLSSSDRWFLNYFLGEDTVGIYSFAYSIAIIGLIVNTAIAFTWIPESIKMYEENSEGAPSILGEIWGALALSLLLVWLVVASLGGDTIRFLADSRFHAGATYVPWIAGGVFFYGMAQLANTGLFISKNLKPAAELWFIGGVLNIILNFFTIKIWGAYGAAVTNCLSFGFIFFGIMFKSLKLFKMNLAWEKLLLATVIVLLCGVLMSPAWHVHPIVSICLKLPIYFGVSLCLTWLTVPNWVSQFRIQLRQYRNRIR